MRLLRSSKNEFEEFFDSQIPEYAILSHRWGPDEVSFGDMSSGKQLRGAGIQKIQHCCQLAKDEGFEWVWIDSCCIDKKSSAELSEAINSMYQWYRDAEVCYAYLSDVHADATGCRPEEDFSPWAISFQESVWFKRGWTLQELLAPKRVYFLDQSWRHIGTKHVLAERISSITGIDIQVCQGSKDITSFSVAQRMSWAAGRVTSRKEDQAYCLMGIFDINMPLLYGEGYKAFLRLQEEIIRVSADESIFAWNSGQPEGNCMLARSPDQFEGAGNVREHDFGERTPYSITNRGLEMTAFLIEAPNKPRGTFLVPVNCSKDQQSPLALIIRKGDMANERYARSELVEMKEVVSGEHVWSFEGCQKQVIYAHLRPH